MRTLFFLLMVAVAVGALLLLVLRRPAPQVTVELMGGLGNQLFQVAYAYAWARDHDRPFVVNHDTTWLHVGTSRPTYWDTVFEWTTHGNPRATRTETLDPALDASVCFRGYFQTPEAWARIEPHLPTLRRLILGTSFATTETIGVHVRRGDYVNHFRHPTEPPEYFVDGVNQMPKHLPVRVFTDDPTWCAQHLPAEWKVVHNATDVEDFLQLAACRHRVISASTFSWWAHQLGQQPDSQLVMPRRWFLDNTDARLFVPPVKQ